MKTKILKPRKRSVYSLQAAPTAGLLSHATRWRWEIWSPGRIRQLVASSPFDYSSPNRATRAARVLFKAILDGRVF